MRVQRKPIFFSRLRRERKKAHLTQMDLARFSGVKQSTISKLETTAFIDPSFETLTKLAWALRKCGRKVDASSLLPKRQLAAIKGFRAERKGRRFA
jgi:predicted transcriptional regulator